ncbi:MAG: gamma-glutamylcyclotransferase [Nitratireductor sp.]|nr:gamma-glutamylcyclotransferase [Nitratireductor sp.]MCC0019752.1 gamma-glutamylcyclotransferase [Nitratireductor sp.]
MDGLIAYFGYGSLVNRKTLTENHQGLYPAHLSGWRRHWQSRGDDIPPGVALLSVHEAPGTTISGMLVVDDRSVLPDLDLREKRYDRVRISRESLGFGTRRPSDLPEEIYVYVGHPPPVNAGETRLLQSYLDTVLAGFLAEHGEAGLENFIQTTQGFERAMICDREKPRYGRAVPIDADMAGFFDGLLRNAGVRFERPEA